MTFGRNFIFSNIRAIFNKVFCFQIYIKKMKIVSCQSSCNICVSFTMSCIHNRKNSYHNRDFFS